jgi:hypothetical protein
MCGKFAAKEHIMYHSFGSRRRDYQSPGSNSALLRSSARNPRNLPCPTCGEPNKLTPADKAKGYQCDDCADRAEGY